MSTPPGPHRPYILIAAYVEPGQSQRMRRVYTAVPVPTEDGAVCVMDTVSLFNAFAAMALAARMSHVTHTLRLPIRWDPAKQDPSCTAVQLIIPPGVEVPATLPLREEFPGTYSPAVVQYLDTYNWVPPELAHHRRHVHASLCVADPYQRGGGRVLLITQTNPVFGDKPETTEISLFPETVINALHDVEARFL